MNRRIEHEDVLHDLLRIEQDFQFYHNIYGWIMEPTMDFNTRMCCTPLYLSQYLHCMYYIFSVIGEREDCLSFSNEFYLLMFAKANINRRSNEKFTIIFHHLKGWNFPPLCKDNACKTLFVI